MADKYLDLTETQLNERHNQKMAKKKLAHDKILSKKILKKGLIMVHTGKGKGKTTAAIGLAIRAIGNDMNVAIVQFVKGAWNTGEKKIIDMFPDNCKMYVMGEGFTWETQDRQRDIDMATEAWQKSKSLIADKNIDLVILDEINIAIRYKYIDIDDVLLTLKNKRPNLHIVLTGRNANQAIIDIADLVTEMTMIKHHFQNDVMSQLGIEY